MIASGHSVSWQERVPTSARVPVTLGLIVILLFCGGFGAWAVTAPLSGAIVTAGVMRASGQNQMVDHLEGGTIAAIPVREGQRVREGDILLTVDTTRTAAERDRLHMALVTAQAQLARARAERDGAEELVFTPPLAAAADDAGLGGELAQQRSEFAYRRERHRAELAAISEQVRAAGEEIAGLKVQKAAEERKLAVLREDLRDKAALLKRGLVPRGEVNALRRAEADSLGTAGSLAARMGERRAAMAQLRHAGMGLEARRRENASREVNELTARIADLGQQLRRQEDVLARAVIRAPADGIIVKLPKNTVGSALKPGETVAEVLPVHSELLVEARIAPQDVDAVRPGQTAKLRLAAFSSRTVRDVDGEVAYVSADRLTDAEGREAFYTARIRLAAPLPEGVTSSQIQPGMPVEAYIRTGDRTFLEYLLEPFLDSFARAFRES